jgi:phospholipid/cholesterol/gamma-HCH transport system substrate-binding protein
MRERGLEFKVGLLIVIALAVLGAFIFILGNFSLRDGFTVNVLYEFSGNVHPGAPVKVSGIKVGKVQSVDYIGGKESCARTGRPMYVKVEVWIEDRVQDSIKTDAEFYVNTAGVLGEQYLEIVPGTAADHIQGGMTLCGESPPRTDLIVSRLYDVLEALSRVLKDDRDVITKLLTNSASAVNELNLFLTENRQEMGKLLVSANRLAGEASDVLAKVDEGIGDPKIIGKTVRDADALLVSANHSVSTLTPPAKELLVDAKRATGIITEQRMDRALEVADKAVAVAGKAGGLIDNVNGMVTDLRKGKGTAGALLVREEVYADLREMLRDLKRNPWKFFWKE